MCWNSYMLSIMTRSCTLYILAQVLPVHSSDEFEFLFLSSLTHSQMRTLRNGSRKRFTAYGTQSYKFFMVVWQWLALIDIVYFWWVQNSEDRCSDSLLRGVSWQGELSWERLSGGAGSPLEGNCLRTITCWSCVRWNAGGALTDSHPEEERWRLRWS